MASSEVLSQTLFSITNIKLEQLKKQKDAYETGKRALLEDVALETDHRKRARVLIEGAEKLPVMTPLSTNPMISIDNFKRFVLQAEHDPSVSEYFVQDYEDTLRNELNVQSNKYEFAALYGKLVNEWIALGKAAGGSGNVKSGEGDKDDDAMSSTSDGGFFPVGREEMHLQRATWEEYVFTPKETDVEAIRAYLDDIFVKPSKDVKAALEGLRKRVRDFQEHWDDHEHFDEESLSNCIRGMLRTDVLSDEKRATLRDFLGNEVVLEEIADVLNMRMATRRTWQWEAPLLIDQRRNLNGRYRFYPDEDLLQAIFMHYIGLRWAVELRAYLLTFVGQPGVWLPDTKPISKADLRRREYFLPNELVTSGAAPIYSLQSKREAHFREEILLDQLPGSMSEQRGDYGGGDRGEDDDDDAAAGDTRKSHGAVVQHLLHMIQADVLLQTRLGHEVTVIRSDYKWFGPSIPHSSIFAVLEYFGVDADWLSFFRRVLEAPLRFRDDPADAEPRVRRRGTPLSTPIADLMGEALLFCGDFAVNRLAGGTRLYRLHDDMWLWGGTDACARSWAALTRFAAVVGLDFNETKTGSARILKRTTTTTATTPGTPASRGAVVVPEAPPTLPRGDVVWGFLKLDPATGRFVLDADEVDRHAEELRLQLAACRSVLDWVQAWNRYGSRFFATHLGRPANCYGRAHVDAVLAAFERIQRRLFAAEGSVGGHLKAMVAERCQGGSKGGEELRLLRGAADIPDGYLYFPVSLGGLGLQNPFVGLYLVREQVAEDPDAIVDEFLEAEETEYRRAREAYEAAVGGSSDDDGEGDSNGDSGPTAAQKTPHSRRGWAHWPPIRRNNNNDDFADLRDEPFMSLAEFTRHRERTSPELGRAFDRLTGEPAPRDVEAGGVVKAALSGGTSGPGWDELGSYDRWVVQLFHRDMLARFGGLQVVDRGLLPTGLMGMLRQSRFRWQG